MVGCESPLGQAAVGKKHRRPGEDSLPGSTVEMTITSIS